jgi:hypothetical protein
MKWIRERDTLIAQTLAFVQTVTGKKDEAAKSQVNLGRADVEVASFEALRTALDIVEPPKDAASEYSPQHAAPANASAGRAPAAEAPRKSPQLSRPVVSSELQREIQSRIEGFRAHQERFNRERAEYFNATLAKLRAAINEVPPTGNQR